VAQAPVTVGTMNFGGRTPAAEAHRIVDRALERGITHFDTADVYGKGESERVVGQALKGRRDRAFIATKCGASGGLAKARVLAAIDESLQRLGTEWVDLYYLHLPDAKTPIEETLEALAVLLENGKVRSWGVSNYASWQIVELNRLCDARSMKRPAFSQVLYNLLIRQLDVEYFAFAKRFPIHTTVYNPLAGGMLAGGTRGQNNAMYARRYWSEGMRQHAEKYRGLGGFDLVTLAYAWVAGRPGVDSVLSGPGTVAHLDAAIDACALVLPDEVRKRIDEIHSGFLGTDARYAR
jgi:aryl-alcohol dehydrogenase-like predicted oxidoreductase